MAVIMEDSSAFVSAGRLYQFESEIRDRIDRIENNIIRQIDGIIAANLYSLIPSVTRADLNELNKKIEIIKNDTSNKRIDMILTEGVTDKEYLNESIEIFSPILAEKINISQ